MSLIYQFYTDDADITVAVADLLARYKQQDLTPRRANDDFDQWIEFDETNTLVFLNSETDQCSAGRVDLSLASLAEDIERILGPLREYGFTISDEDEEI